MQNPLNKFVVIFNTGEVADSHFAAFGDSSQLLDVDEAMDVAAALDGVGSTTHTREAHPLMSAFVVPADHPALSVDRNGYVRVDSEVLAKHREVAQ